MRVKHPSSLIISLNLQLSSLDNFFSRPRVAGNFRDLWEIPEQSQAFFSDLEVQWLQTVWLTQLMKQNLHELAHQCINSSACLSIHVVLRVMTGTSSRVTQASSHNRKWPKTTYYKFLSRTVYIPLESKTVHNKFLAIQYILYGM